MLSWTTPYVERLKSNSGTYQQHGAAHAFDLAACDWAHRLLAYERLQTRATFSPFIARSDLLLQLEKDPGGGWWSLRH
jgi:hypothetical protein